ncbi:MAG: AMP-binding protein [Syntrophorhabdales bacterium]|jgi:2,3-dihydroxybenzoate-AMP ligase/mycobactin salicyl-AMP ligase
MSLEFPRHSQDQIEKYTNKRWWSGLTLGDILDRVADVFPTKEAVVDDRVRITYAELRERTERLAAGLMRAGIKQGECVMLQLPNWSEYVYSYFALQKIGAIPVVLISGYKQLEVSHLGKLTEATAWIVPAAYRKIDYASFLGEVRSFNPQLKQVISVRASGSTPGFTSSLETLMELPVTEEEREELALRRPDPTNAAHIIPSGGTTGLPKGIPRTHNDYICNVEYLHRGWEMNTGDVTLVVVPVGHNLALLNVVGSILFAYKLVLLDSTKPVDICATIEAEKVTYMPTVPSLVRRIVEQSELGTYNLASLKKISAGGEPSTPELIREVYDKLRCTYINEFGMSEGLLCRTSLTDDVDTICTTVGKPCCPYDEVRILDTNGYQVPPGSDGELATRGPCIFAGYLNNPEENAKSFTSDGFFRTGDQARTDAAGNLRITGRIKDLIIRGGENVTPSQVEDLLCQSPEVADAAVIGIPDKELGEKVCAYVRLASGATPDPDKIRNFMESKGASKLLIPERFVFVETLPLTPAGKHDKKALREDVKHRIESGRE